MKVGDTVKKLPVVFVLILFFLTTSASGIFAVGGGNVRTFILDTAYLSMGKALWKSGDPHFKRNIKRLIKDAEKALTKGPYSVTYKKYHHPGGDRHDYLAYGNYCWPNPDTPDGLPWVTRDGFSNPDATMDRDAFKNMVRDTSILSLAYYYTGNEAYAGRAAFLLRTWFIDKETRMNPNCNFGKVIPGVIDGGYSVAGFGYRFRELYDSAGILESSPAWTAEDRDGLQKWTREFMTWVESSPYGKNERYSQSNHSTFYHMTKALQAMYVGETAKARTVLEEYMNGQMPRQFSPDGSQPYEMIRANNYDYHLCNLEVAYDIARLAEHFAGLDVWHFKSEEGGGLRRSTDFMVPYIKGEKEWPYFKSHKFKIVELHKYRLLRRAALGFRDRSFEKALKEIPRDYSFSWIDICYPEAALETKTSTQTGAEAGGKVRLFILKEAHLALSKALWKGGDKKAARDIRTLVQQAKKALGRGPYSVTHKKYRHPGGDQHDFLAYGAYYWPNPETKDGLPWVVRDGFPNPDAEMDWKEFNPMARESWLSALAYYFTGNEDYARHSAFLLRTWFIDEKTRMNPRVEYGKVIPGVMEGGYAVAGFGYGFRQVYDAAGILESSVSWSKADREAFQGWTRDFLKWSETSSPGKMEYYSKSNHSTFYHLIAAIQAMYVGDDEKARATIKNYIYERIPAHFKPDGTQPFEMVRANNFDYHRCNLEAAVDIAALAEHYTDRYPDIDAWGFTTKEGAGLRRSLEFLVSYLTGEKEWTYFKKHKFTIPRHHRARLLRRGALGYNDISFEKAVRKVNPTYGMYLVDLCYPKAAITKKQ